MSRPRTSLLLFTLYLQTCLFSNAAARCYCMAYGQVSDCSERASVCGNASALGVEGAAQVCCVNGDQCGRDGICRFTKTIPNTSGFYLGGCTDRAWGPGCQRSCIDAGTADIVYNNTNGLWSCCAYPDTTVRCQAPRSDITFPAIPMQEFPGTTTSISSSMISASTSTPSSSTTPTTGSGSTVSTSESARGLSTGAVAGISVAAIVVGLGVMACAVFIYLRRRKRSTQAAELAARETTDANLNESHGFLASRFGIYQNRRDKDDGQFVVHEADAGPIPVQLYGSETRPVQELP